ncbi:hypothetical protein HN713_03045 [bacterium]|jgi:hypothetical protein|nr:hypothetical protein [bacterium]
MIEGVVKIDSPEEILDEQLTRPVDDAVIRKEDAQVVKHKESIEREKEADEIREIKKKIGLSVKREDLKQDFTNKERDEFVDNFKKALESSEDTKLFEKNISENLTFTAYKGAARFGGGIMFRISEGEEIKAQITFNPEEGNVLNMVHREVQSQSLGISGNSFLKKIEECFEILKKEEVLPQETTFSMESGQVTVVQWALKNGYIFKDDGQRQLFDAIASGQKNDEYVITDIGDGKLFDSYIFRKETYESHEKKLKNSAASY